MEQLDIQVERLQFVISRAVSSDWKMPRRENKHCLLAYFRSGSGCYHIGDQRFSVGAGNVILIPPEQAYHSVMDPENPWSYCTVGLHLTCGNEASRNALRAMPVVLHAPELADAFSQLQSAWEEAGAGRLLRCRSILLQILYQLLCREPQTRNFTGLEPVFAAIRWNNGKNYSLEELAAKANMSVSCFCRQFRAATGTSAVEFQNHTKIERAKQLLLSGDLNVSQVAQEVGIENVFYFSRLFRRITGESPSAFQHSL